MRDESREINATLRASLEIECPGCGHEFDLFDHDDDGLYLRPIFNNKWDDLQGEDIECPKCGCSFILGKVEW